MSSHPLQLLALLALGSLCACQSSRSSGDRPALAATMTVGKKKFDLAARNNALALLNELLNEDKHVSKILLIKRESSELNRLVKNISEAARRGADDLKILARLHPELDLTATGLPSGEKAARESIAKVKQHALLHSSGAEFELQLLLTQAEALGYGTHLALVAAENEPHPDRAREFLALSTRLKELHGRVLAMLRSPK